MRTSTANHVRPGQRRLSLRAVAVAWSVSVSAGRVVMISSAAPVIETGVPGDPRRAVVV